MFESGWIWRVTIILFINRGINNKSVYLVRRSQAFFMAAFMLLLLGCGNDIKHVFSDPKIINLVDAAQQGDENKVISLIERGIDPNAKGEKGVTSLHWLMHKNDMDGMELLLKHGASPNLAMSKGEIENVLELSVIKDKKAALLLLLQYGGDPNFKGTSFNLFQHALYERNIGLIKLLLEHGGSNTTPLNYRLFSVSYYASYLRFYEVVELLIKQGEDPLFVRDSGETLAHQVQKFKSGSDAYFRVKNIMTNKGVKFPIPRAPQIGVAKLVLNLEDPKVKAWVAKEEQRINKNFNIYMHVIDYYLGKKDSNLELPKYPEHKVFGDAHKDDLFREEYSKNVQNYYVEVAEFLDIVEPEWRQKSKYLVPKPYSG